MKTFIKIAKGWREVNKNPNLTKAELRNIVANALRIHLIMEDKK